MATNTGSFNSNIDDNNRSPEYRAKTALEARRAALEAERDAYKARGNDERARLVEESLKALEPRDEKDADSKGTTRNVPQSVETRTTATPADVKYDGKTDAKKDSGK